VLTVWSDAGEMLRTRDTGQEGIFSIATFVKSDRIATAGHFGVSVWDGQLATCIRLEPNHKKVWHLALSPDESLLAGGTVSGDIYIWDLRELRLKATLVGHRGWVNAVCFSPDGLTLASAGNDLRMWDVRTWQQMAQVRSDTTPPIEPISYVEFAPDGLGLLFCGPNHGHGTIRVWSARNR